MKLWTNCTDFLRTSPAALAGVVVAFVLCIILLVGIVVHRLPHIFGSIATVPFHPDNGAVLFGSGVFCTFDGRNWQPVHQLSDGNYVCFPPSTTQPGSTAEPSSVSSSTAFEWMLGDAGAQQ